MIALTRAVPSSISRCELTHQTRVPIDHAVATAQHAAYEAALTALGCRVERVPAAPDLPDSVFIEDTAVVLDELAIIMRPGAVSRHGELPGVAAALAKYRAVHTIDAPATMDGGDVLVVGRRIFVGLSSRTNERAVRQLQRIVEPLGDMVTSVMVTGCLHLKSAVTALTDHLLLLNPRFIDGRALGDVEWVEIDPDEPSAANVVRVGDTCLCAESAPNTQRRLEQRGLSVRAVEASELAKAEGALTCCSLIFTAS